ncbi:MULTISPECIES: COG4223 family protein [Methylosinus]|uniref:Mitochondrial inner membrane protein n=1 Tax=Methylosinus trichosporium (strain ATCC 35070 / NCIMB 11131 / UNIQEM 75 / OB3b) TaxID=595536 RepID=A0A2D2D1C4_METT3|nr:MULTISPECIES: hypothetical protein [Methylosinus]ATQ68669.1 hypothetical protein CQW49_12835 [Methylosinus trichosporium OB3b]OBS53167.1 hypothetical protein A8B73_07685 [Methylosinus sp. 3S-1]
MAQDEKDPETRGSGALDAAAADRPSVEPADSVEAQPALQATPAPMEAAPPTRRKNRLLMTSAVAILGLAATAGAIAAYRFRDKHEKLAAFAALVDDYSARPEKLVASLRETSVKWLGDAARPSKKPPSPAPEPRPPLHAEIKPTESKPAESKPASPSDDGERITWSAPPPIDAPTPPPRPVLEAPPAPAHEPPPVVAALPELDSEARAEIDALTKRLGELEQIARSALNLAEQARDAAANAPTPTPSAPAASAATPEFRDLNDNVSGLEGRIDELGDEMKALRERLDSPKDESRLPKEAMIEPPQKPAEDEPNPAAVVVIAHSLQKALERGAPFSTEFAALAAQGADKEALERLAASAETGAPTPHTLKTAFHPLVKRMETAAEPHAEESLSDRLIHGASKLVKMRAPGEATKIEIAEITTKIEAALGHEDIGAALAAFADLPEDARALAREWEESARRRLEADSAAATILSSAIAALGKKGKS